MDKTTLLAMAIGWAFVAFTAASILWQCRERVITASLRAGLGLTAAGSIIWAATNVARVLGIDRLSALPTSLFQISLPAALCFVLVGMHRGMKR